MNKLLKKHTVDVLFVLLLFCTFAFSVISLTGIGAGVYQNVVDKMSESYNERISYSYFINKVRQSDVNGNISSGTFKGTNALIISEEIDNITYHTYLYCFEGHIKEMFVRAGNEFDPSFGTDIMEVENFSVDCVTDSLFKLTVTPIDSSTETIFIHSRSK